MAMSGLLPRVPPLGSRLAAVALGGAAGTVGRHVVVETLGDDGVMAWGTLSVDVAGSFLLGLLLALYARRWRSPWWRLALTTGAVASFTTMSALAVEAMQRVRDGRVGWALTYVAVTAVAGVVAAALGFGTGRRLAGDPPEEPA